MKFPDKTFFANEWNRKNSVLSVVVVLLFNFISFEIVLPHAQSTANSHMSEGPFIGTIYFIIAASLILFFISRLSTKTNHVFAFSILFLSTTFIYWGYKLFHLYCEGCMACG